jgi:hypothetical protein
VWRGTTRAPEICAPRALAFLAVISHNDVGVVYEVQGLSLFFPRSSRNGRLLLLLVLPVFPKKNKVIYK